MQWQKQWLLTAPFPWNPVFEVLDDIPSLTRLDKETEKIFGPMENYLFFVSSSWSQRPESTWIENSGYNMSIVLQRQIFQTKDTHDTSTTISAQNLESFKLNGVYELYLFLSIISTEKESIIQPARSFFRLRISWNSSSVWLKVTFLFGNENWGEQLKIKSDWESTDITISAWNRKCRRRKRLVLSRDIHIKLLIVIVLRDTSCRKIALVFSFMSWHMYLKHVKSLLTESLAWSWQEDVQAGFVGEEGGAHPARNRLRIDLES